MDLGNVITRWVSQAPKDVYLAKDDRKLSPQAIWSQANCLATGLVSLGLKSGEGVAVWMQSTPELAVTYLAVQFAGGCFVPIPYSTKSADLARILERSNSAIAIISLDLYDRYHSAEARIQSVRHLVVDAGEIGAETTLPSNAKSLTPMLMVGRDVTLPDTEPHSRSLCFFPDENSEPVEKYRENERWERAVAAASKSFGKNEIVLNTLDLLHPEALMLGTIWPLLAYSTVYVQGVGSEGISEVLKSNRIDTMLMNSDAAEIILKSPSMIKFPRVLWQGSFGDAELERIAKMTGGQLFSLKDAVDSANFL